MSEDFKLTNQRLIILDYMKDNYRHPSVEEVYLHVKKRLPRISKKTVYRNLQFLCEEGLIQEAKVSGVQRYEPKIAPHQHMICKRCHKVTDVHSDELYSHAKDVGKTFPDFEVESLDISYYGICKRCKEVEKDGRRK